MPKTTLQEGFVDLQVKGYAGIDFNSDSLTLEGLRAACQRLRADRVASVLATAERLRGTRALCPTWPTCRRAERQ